MTLRRSSPRQSLPDHRSRAGELSSRLVVAVLLVVGVTFAVVTGFSGGQEPTTVTSSLPTGSAASHDPSAHTSLSLEDVHPTSLATGAPSSFATAGVAAPGSEATSDAFHGVAAAATTAPEPLGGTVDDGWSTASMFRTRDKWYASPIHATLMPDGRIFFVGIARDKNPPESATKWRRVAWVFKPPAIGKPIPASTTITEIPEPVEYDAFEAGTEYYLNDDFYCMGATLTYDGKVVTAGGTRTVIDHTTGYDHTFGLPYETIFDGTSWVRQPGAMLGIDTFEQPTRWYPTVTRLPDRRVLVSGGLTVIAGPDDIGYANHTVETYDTDTGARTLFSDATQTPTALQARDYNHAFVLPYADATYDLMEIGEPGQPLLASTADPGTWDTSQPARPGDGGDSTNWGSSSSMLPLRVNNGEWGYVNGAVQVASGDMHTPFEHTMDVWDPGFGWTKSVDLLTTRHHPSTVLLPDSRTLVVNGHDTAGGTAVQQAQYIDPASGFSVTAGKTTSGITRGYHSIALLLPDGRVFVAGGRDADTKTSLEKASYQIYSPDYLQRTRPTITKAPTTLSYDTTFSVTTKGPVPTEVMLMGLGSMTHSFDSNQRAIELPMGIVTTTSTSTKILAGTPPDSHVAPPGYYLLVVLSTDRTPSIAKVVRIS